MGFIRLEHNREDNRHTAVVCGAPSFAGKYRSLNPAWNRTTSVAESATNRADENSNESTAAKDCDSTEGRWVAPDPAGFVDGANLYQFVDSDPSTETDPAGLFPMNHIFTGKDEVGPANVYPPQSDEENLFPEAPIGEVVYKTQNVELHLLPGPNGVNGMAWHVAAANTKYFNGIGVEGGGGATTHYLLVHVTARCDGYAIGPHFPGDSGDRWSLHVTMGLRQDIFLNILEIQRNGRTLDGVYGHEQRHVLGDISYMIVTLANVQHEFDNPPVFDNYPEAEAAALSFKEKLFSQVKGWLHNTDVKDAQANSGVSYPPLGLRPADPTPYPAGE